MVETDKKANRARLSRVRRGWRGAWGWRGGARGWPGSMGSLLARGWTAGGRLREYGVAPGVYGGYRVVYRRRDYLGGSVADETYDVIVIGAGAGGGEGAARGGR